MYLGLDIGTSAVKALLMDNEQRIIDAADAPLQVLRPAPGMSEQNPEDWIAAVKTAIDALKSRHPSELSAVTGIGLSGQMHGAVLLNKASAPLRPCILWNDGRSAEECALLEARADFRGIGGNIVMAGFTAPKLEWVRRYEPHLFGRIAKVLVAKDYVRLWLTGELAAEMSDASGTLWLDIAKRAWSPELVSASGLSMDQLAPLVEGTEVTGHLRSELAQLWGMDRPVVAGGGGDNAATACGMGVLAPGSAFISLGTSGVLFGATSRFIPNTENAVHAFCHAVPDRWHHMGVILSAVDSLSWLGEITGHSAAELSALLPGRIEKPSTATFLPYLSGERTPHNDPSARGAFIGLERGTCLADLVQAVMEGVAFALADCADALAAAETHLDAAYAVGGGTQSRSWLQIIAAATGLTLLLPEAGSQGGAYGAAKLAMIADSGADPADICRPAKVLSEISPDRALAQRYQAHKERFRASYPLLRQL